MRRNFLVLTILFLLSAFLVLRMPFAVAANDTNKDDGSEKNGAYLTRGDAAKLIVASDFLKNKIGQLLSWSIGYDISAVNRATLVPTIKRIKARPVEVPPDGRTVFSLLVEVDDPGGLSNISGVRADLSNIGQLPNTTLVDNGLWGDFQADDGIFTIQTNVRADITDGKKEISVAVANKEGWLTLSRAELNVERNPRIVWAKAIPSKVKSDGKSSVLLEVAIINPGRIEDVKYVIIDLSQIGGEKEVKMLDNGRNGDKTADDGIFSLEAAVPSKTIPGRKNLQIVAENSYNGKSYEYIILEVI